MAATDVKAIQALADRVITGLGYGLVDLEWKHEAGHWVLRVYIDLAGAEPAVGVSHEDCSRASHALSAELDVADLIHAAYHLEVSSPGLNRPLKREVDFRRFVGKRAKIRMRHGLPSSEPGVAPRRNFAGRLVGAEGGKVSIDVDGQVFTLEVEDVEKANLQAEL